jgi:hypothetical protein
VTPDMLDGGPEKKKERGKIKKSFVDLKKIFC